MDEERKPSPVGSAVNESIRPDFLGGSSSRESASPSAAEDLGTIEKAASNGDLLEKKDNGLDEAKETEKSGGFFTGSGKSDDKNKKKKGKFKGGFKKKGPIVAIFMAILGFSGMSFFGMSMELVAWKENLSSMFGQGSAVISRRSNYMMKALLGDNSHKGTLKNTVFGDTKFKIGSKLQQKFKENDIDYIEETTTDGKKIKMLVFEDDDGRRIPVFANEGDVQRAKGLNLEIDGKKIDFSKGTTLAEAKTTNKKFSVSYDDATLTFTGKIAGWFDSMTSSLYERIIGKNARNQTDIDDPDDEKVNKVLLGNASEGLDDNDIDATTTKIETDENGNQKQVTVKAIDSDEVGDSGETYGSIKDKKGSIRTDNPSTDTVSSSLTAKAKKIAMMSPTLACGFLRGIGGISMAVGAMQTMNVIQYASKYLELADKIKAGQADETINIAMNNLNTKRRTPAYDIDGERLDDLEGSVTESAGWGQVFSSQNIINENDSSALLMNRELANKNALRYAAKDNELLSALASVVGAGASFGAGIEAFRYCNGIQMAMGVVSFAGDVIGIFTLGAGKFIKDFVVGALNGAKMAAAMAAIGVVVAAITPKIANWFAGQLGDVFLGKNGGFALLSGAQNIMNSNLQMSTGRYADNTNAKEVFALTQDVEREWAAYERATKSPFDITSKYTFLGSVYNSTLPLIRSSRTSVMATILSATNLVSNLTVSMISPSVDAADETNKFANSLSSGDNCGYLQSVNVAGDFACNKYAGAYVGALTTESPIDIYERMAGYGSFDGEDGEGNPRVKNGSNYAKYIIACVSNDAQPGTMSAAVQGYINEFTTTDSNAANGLINFGRNFIPFEGALDFAEGIEGEAQLKWNTGLACTGNTGDAEFDQQIKDFSMYNLDQRVLHDMGVIENNSTVSFLEDYHKENPLDDSFEGKIARFSGMSKDEVEDTLALIDYYRFLNEYDASERYAFGEPAVKDDGKMDFSNGNKIAEMPFILLNEISFTDVRNRSFAV
ncbi:hypothetical protein IJI29_02855 [Candidatus Saccharibacteria bacterium]|nr:hypothetical protein [Candidatus Saccharibacteria bacterium]